MSLRSFLKDGFALRVVHPASAEHLDTLSHQKLVAEIQRFRGSTYVDDGAIPLNALDDQGRHQSDCDDASYHLVVYCADGQLQGCLRLYQHSSHVNFDNMHAKHILSRMPEHIAHCHQRALNEIIAVAQEDRLSVTEVGGWAVAPRFRRRGIGAILPLSGWALCGLLGHSYVVSFATDRHASANILLRMGGFKPISGTEPLPQFFDPYHGCPMHMIAFDTRRVAPGYSRIVNDLTSYLEPFVKQRNTSSKAPEYWEQTH